MKASTFTILFSLFRPILIVTIFYFLSHTLRSLHPALQGILNYIPYVVFGLFAILSFRFNRERVVTLLFILCIGYSVFDHFLKNANTNLSGFIDLPSLTIYQALNIFLPLNVLIFCFFRDRGILTLIGGLRMLIVVGQLIFTYTIIVTENFSPTEFIDTIFLPLGFFNYFTLSQFSILINLICIIAILLKIVLKKMPEDNAYFGAVLAICCGNNLILQNNCFLMFITLAGTLLGVSVLRDSYNMAYRDELTGILGRRALNEKMLSLGRKYCIAMLDVDHFKKFNDTYGHDVGDQVLQMVASKINKVSGGGKAYRYGGEEFTVLFNGKSIDQVIPHLTKIRKNIETYKMVIRNENRPEDNEDGIEMRSRENSSSSQKVSVTISIGVCEKNDTHKDAEEVIKGADEALYRAKEGGRNQVSV